jgi:hypothetical protein
MKANTSFNPTPANLRKAAELAESIENMQNELTALLNGTTVTTVAPANKRGRGKFTPAQRARISAGLKAKWAERHAAKLAASPAPVAGGVTIDQTIPAGAAAVKMVSPNIKS